MSLQSQEEVPWRGRLDSNLREAMLVYLEEETMMMREKGQEQGYQHLETSCQCQQSLKGYPGSRSLLYGRQVSAEKQQQRTAK